MEELHIEHSILEYVPKRHDVKISIPIDALITAFKNWFDDYPYDFDTSSEEDLKLMFEDFLYKEGYLEDSYNVLEDDGELEEDVIDIINWEAISEKLKEVIKKS